MRFFRNRTVAIVITALIVAGCLVYGFIRKPADLIRVRENIWIADSAGVFSGLTKDTVTSRNRRWDSSAGSVVAVAAVKSTKGWEIEDYALSLGEKWDLGKNDMLLLLDIGGDDYTIVYTASKIVADSDVNAALASSGFGAAFAAGDYDGAVQGFFSALDDCYSAISPKTGNFVLSNPFYYDSGYGSGVSAAVLIVIPLLVLALLISAVDRARYRTWYGRYHGVKGAPLFIPILFWHRPGGVWFRRMSASMRTPPFGRGRGPGPGGGFGGGFGGGRGGGFGGGFGGGRGGGFGGGFGGGRGGGFGGGFGGGRGGGFGGRK